MQKIKFNNKIILIIILLKDINLYESLYQSQQLPLRDLCMYHLFHILPKILDI